MDHITEVCFRLYIRVYLCLLLVKSQSKWMCFNLMLYNNNTKIIFWLRNVISCSCFAQAQQVCLSCKKQACHHASLKRHLFEKSTAWLTNNAIIGAETIQPNIVVLTLLYLYKSLLTGTSQWLKDSNKTIKREVFVECWEQWEGPEFNNTCREGTVCPGMALSHIFILPGVPLAPLTLSQCDFNAFLRNFITFLFYLTPPSARCLWEVIAFKMYMLSRGKDRQWTAFIICTKYLRSALAQHTEYTRPWMEVVHLRICSPVCHL